MSRMGRLAVEIDEAGIDWSVVDLEAVAAYRDAYRANTQLVVWDGLTGKWQVHEGHDIPVMQAIREIYGGIKL